MIDKKGTRLNNLYLILNAVDLHPNITGCKLSSLINKSYDNTFMTVKLMIKHGLASKVKSGRTCSITLTTKGVETLKLISDNKHILKIVR